MSSLCYDENYSKALSRQDEWLQMEKLEKIHLPLCVTKHTQNVQNDVWKIERHKSYEWMMTRARGKFRSIVLEKFIILMQAVGNISRCSHVRAIIDHHDNIFAISHREILKFSAIW